MAKKWKQNVIVIRRSCITGKVVWIYHGTSKEAAYRQYWVACKAEIERVKNWGEHVKERSANIAMLLARLTENLPINAELTPQQKKAANRLLALQKKPEEMHREFYDHIMEERRRREEDREIRRKMREREQQEHEQREREMSNKPNYDK